MATYRGMDGSVQHNSQPVAEIKGWTLNASAEMLEDTVQGDPWRTFVGGLATWSGSAQGNFDYGDTNGQKAIVDKILAATPNFTPVTMQFRVSATKFLTGTAIISQVQPGAQLGQITEATFQFQGTGALTPSWT